VIVKASHGHQGAERAAAWRAAAAEAVELYRTYPAMPWTDLAAEVASEVRLLRATQAELAGHAQAREEAPAAAEPGWRRDTEESTVARTATARALRAPRSANQPAPVSAG
jgi:hypothetical protein